MVFHGPLPGLEDPADPPAAKPREGIHCHHRCPECLCLSEGDPEDRGIPRVRDRFFKGGQFLDLPDLWCAARHWCLKAAGQAPPSVLPAVRQVSLHSLLSLGLRFRPIIPCLKGPNEGRESICSQALSSSEDEVSPENGASVLGGLARFN